MSLDARPGSTCDRPVRLMIHPVVVGSGRRLFENGAGQVSLELVDSQSFSTGVLNLTYRPAGA
jgi:dihydrofolate reductase